ncbi:hypothetical protein [Ruegeria sp. SCP11]|uniref:hypothetical protein n=1 Tax=Ruegeria sp. SCP11 TaxID=3141378 RepID=UPI003334AEE2
MDDLDAYGFSVRDGVSQGVSNSGTITMQITAEDEAEAIGLRLSSEVDANVINSGTVSIVTQSTANDTLGYGRWYIEFGQDRQSRWPDPGQDHGVKLDANGGSSVFRFEDASVGVGVSTITASDALLPGICRAKVVRCRFTPVSMRPKC